MPDGSTLEGVVEEFGGDFVASYLDGGQRGPATQLVESMLQDAVDITDPVVVQAWIDRYNRSLP